MKNKDRSINYIQNTRGIDNIYNHTIEQIKNNLTIDEISQMFDVGGCTQSSQCLQCLSDWRCFHDFELRNLCDKQQIVCPSDCSDECYIEYPIVIVHYNI